MTNSSPPQLEHERKFLREALTADAIAYKEKTNFSYAVQVGDKLFDVRILNSLIAKGDVKCKWGTRYELTEKGKEKARRGH